MRKSVFLICGIMFAYSNNCSADEPIKFGVDFRFDGCVTIGCGKEAVWYPHASPSERNCKAYTRACVYMDGKVTGVASCYACNYGYSLVEHPANISACSQSEYDISDNSGSVSYSYTSCEKNCSSSNCYPDSWKALRTGYESRTNRSCSVTGPNGTCNTSTQYRCAAGYYGSSTNGTSGCTQCPTWTGIYTNSARTILARGTSSAGATAITGCYVVPGTYYDATGTIRITGNCTYK